MARNPRILSRGFNSGELSPEMGGRVDDARYANGLARLRNFICKPQGPATRRPGTQYVDEAHDSDFRVRLVPFVYSTDQSFVLAFGRAEVDGRSIGHIRFYTEGVALQYEAPREYVETQAIASRTGNALNFAAPHGLLVGDPITFTVDGADTLPGGLTEGVIYYAIFIDADTIEVATTEANAIAAVAVTLSSDGTGDRRLHFAYEPGDLVEWTGVQPGNFYCMGRPWTTHLDHPPTDTNYWYREPADLTYEVPHFYSDAALFEFTYAQSNDVLTLAHRDRQLAELRRLGATRWVLANVVASMLASPDGVAVATFRGEGIKIASVTAASPAVLTTTGTNHTLTEEDAVDVEDVGDIPNGLYRVGGALTATTFKLKTVLTNEDVGSGTTTVVAGSRVRHTSLSTIRDNAYIVTAVAANGQESEASAQATATNDLNVPGAYNTVTWNVVQGAARYRVYKKISGLLGFIGQVDADTAGASPSFKDDNITPDLGVTPPILDESLAVSAVVTFTTTTDRVNWTAHELPEGMPVIFSTDGTFPTGIELGVTYYVLNPETDSFQVEAVRGSGTAVNLGGVPAGVHNAVSGFWPGAVGYFEQRRVWAGAWNDPQRVFMTRSSTEADLSYHLPIQDDDRISEQIAARRNTVIRHLVPLGHLVLLTTEGEFRVSPLNSDALTPDSFSSRIERYVGTAAVQPEVANGALVFAADRGGHVYVAGFQELGRFTADSVSLRAAHLFEGLTIVQQAQGKAPLPIQWFVSSGGRLLGMTYVPEQDVLGWHWHDTDGDYESCAVVPEGDEDRLYVVVNRGGTRYVERMGAVLFGDLEDACYLDASLSFDGTNTGATTITPSAGGAYQVGHTVTLTASVATFAFPATTDVGDEVRLSDAEGNVYAVEITATASTTVATGKLLAALPSAMQGAATTLWAWARDTFSGLDHLDGETVTLFGDGEEIGTAVVASGAVSVDDPVVKMTVGLAYESDLQTLDVVLNREAWGQGTTKNINAIRAKVVNSGTFRAGPNETALEEIPLSGLQSQEAEKNLPGDWQEGGRVFIRSSGALPLTVVSLVAEVPVGG